MIWNRPSRNRVEGIKPTVYMGRGRPLPQTRYQRPAFDKRPWICLEYLQVNTSGFWKRKKGRGGGISFEIAERPYGELFNPYGRVFFPCHEMRLKKACYYAF